MHQTTCASSPAARPRIRLRIRQWFSVLTLLRNMAALHRHRRALAQLDAHILNDIGVNSQQAQAESDRPFWDVPANWRA